MQKVILALMLGAASAFAPRPAAKASTVVYGEGKYDDKLWDMDAKKDVWNEWDPNSPRPRRRPTQHFGRPMLKSGPSARAEERARIVEGPAAFEDASSRTPARGRFTEGAVEDAPTLAGSDLNFNPFERNPDGNPCDCSGYFPGEAKYKDPQRPDTDFATMMAEKEIMAEIEANKKPGDVPGAPGCYN